MLGRCIVQFKRILSIILTICLLVSISVVPAFAVSSDPVSYSAIVPSEEMQYMTSGYPVSTYATNNAGYRMELSGVEQNLECVSTSYTYAPTGFSYYNGYLIPTYTPVGATASYYILMGTFDYYVVEFTDSSFDPSSIYFKDSSANWVYPFSSSLSYRRGWTNNKSTQSNSWTFKTGVISASGFCPNQNYVNIFSSFDLYDSSGNLIVAASTPSSFVETEDSVQFGPFSSADMTILTAGDREIVLFSESIAGEISGDQTYSFTSSNPYIDVELPLSAWVDDVPAAEDYWSISVDGTLAFDLAIGLQSKVAGEDKFYYALSDLVPSSWQLICNGTLMEDNRCTGSFDSVASSADGYKASLTISTGELNLGTLDSGEQGITPETLGFRIYLTSASGGAPTTIANSNTFESVTPYVYINFNDADGNSGLPALTFYENYVSGDLSNGDPGDYSVSVNGFSFDFGYYTDVEADSGTAFYNGLQFVSVPVKSGFPFVTIKDYGTLEWCFLSKSQPYWNGEEVIFGSAFGTDWVAYLYDSDSWASWTSAAVHVKVCSLDYHNYDYEGIPAMSPSNVWPGPTTIDLSADGALNCFASNAGYVSGLGAPISYASAGNTGTAYMFSNNSGEGYVDVTYPAEVFGVLSTEEFLSLAVEGNLALRARVFPAVTDSTGKKYGVPYYIDNPYSVQLIFNDVVFSEEYPLNYITDDDSIASVSGLALHFDNFTELDTITFRLKFQYDPERTGWMSMEDMLAGGDSFTIGADLDILTSPVFDPESPPGPVVLPSVNENISVSGGWINGKLPVYHTAAEGYTYYNNFLSPDVVLPDGYSYFILGDFLVGTCIAFTEIPVYGLTGEDGNYFHPPGLPGRYSNGEWVWGADATMSVLLEHIQYANFDFYDTSGALVMAAGAVKNYGYAHSSGAFDLGNMSTVSVGERLFTIEGNKFSGDYLGNFVLSHGDEDFYIDVNIPITQFPTVGSLTDFDSVSLSGDLTLDVALGLLVKTTSGVSRYFISDYVPTSVQVLYNGIIVDDYDQEFAISSDSRSYSGFSVGTIQTNFCKDEGYISTNSMPVVGLSSVGFRIHFDSPTDSDYQTTHSLTNYHFNSVSSYARVSFDTVDGENGLPSLILSKTSTGGNFDDSNIVEWLEKIHTELTTYLPEFSRHFQSMFEEMSAQTDILNEMLVALKDNSAVESVSSTVTNIYNSISNVETSISNVESTINNVSNTVTNMEQTQQAMQQTQEEMKETQKEMEEDTSALRDVYASEDDIVLKEGTSEFSSAVTDVLIGSSGDGSSGLLGSDSGNDVKSLKKLGNRLKEWFSFDADIGELFDIVESGSDWYSQETANGIDCTVSVTTYGRYNDPYSMSDYYEYIDFLLEKYGGDEE